MEIILKIIKASVLMLSITLLASCQKDEDVGTVDLAKVNVINAVVDGGNAKVNVNTKVIPWGSIADDQVLGGANTLNRLYFVPTGMPAFLKVASASDTSKLWYDQQKDLSTGKMYSLYLSGTPAQVKATFHEEVNFPKYILRDAGRPTPVTDSLVNIRFVNLSPTGPKVDINIRGNTVNEVNELSYEAFTAFKAYPTPRSVRSIVFEIRQSSDKQLISTFTLPINVNTLYKSIAIVMMGIYPGSTLPAVDRYRVVSVTYQ